MSTKQDIELARTALPLLAIYQELEKQVRALPIDTPLGRPIHQETTLAWRAFASVARQITSFKALDIKGDFVVSAKELPDRVKFLAKL